MKTKVKDLIPDDKNYNKGNEYGESLIAKSFQKFGAGRSILLDKNNKVIAGNKSLQKFAEQGLEDVQIIESDGKKLIAVKRTDIDLNTPEGREMALADNATAKANIEWDFPNLEMAITEFDLKPLDWGVKMPHEVSEDDYVIPDEIETDIVTGDLFQIGQHRLLCGDSRDSDAVARLMKGKVANLFATDPPYGVALNDETGSGKKAKIENDENDGKKLQEFLEAVFAAWLPSLDKNAAWYLWHAQMTQGFFAAAAAAADVLIHRQIIWVKPSLIMGHGDYHWKHELCFYGWRKGNRPSWYADRKQTTVWEIDRETDENHPTRKPVEIFARPILHNTLPNCIVGEPFAGSGSQFVAAHQTNRACYGIEISPQYCQIIIERMLKLDPSLEIKRNGKTFHVEQSNKQDNKTGKKQAKHEKSTA